MADDNETPKSRACGTMSVHRRLLDSDPSYRRRLERIEEQAFRARASLMVARPGCTLIPVVVHVVWKTAAQNISDAQIHSQIEVLNQDFRKMNADITNVPAPFAPLAGDARIQFELATTAPDGSSTDGILRVKTDKNNFSNDDDGVKFASSGGSDAWPRDDYLNIWVCQLAGSLLGYAQFPGGAPETDGVVVTHTGFGTTGTAAAPFDRGRTTTHEIGHWLNLRHIWGDDGDGCSGSDFVDDTPNQGGSNLGKPAFPSISCSNGPNGDMFMNYMDYVDDDTMVMFSEGQIQRMHACLDGPRSAIGTSVPCIGAPTKPPFKDIVKEPLKEFPKDPPKEPPKDLKEFPKDPPKDIPKDLPKDPPKDPPKDFPKDPPKDFPKEPPKDIPKDFPKDPPKEFPKEPPKDIKEGIFDPGPGPKTILDPPGPGPKTILEPPIEPPFPPLQPGQPTVPFVLGTGAAAGAQPAGGAAAQSSTLDSYTQLLGQYASLYQRGMLDAQGMEGWRQAYAAYRQMGGQ